jgi:hypothetical protein
MKACYENWISFYFGQYTNCIFPNETLPWTVFLIVNSGHGEGTRYNTMLYKLSVTCDMSVGFSGFQHQYSWQSRYNWNIVESGV